MQRRPEKSAIPRRSGVDRSLSDRRSARGFAPLTGLACSARLKRWAALNRFLTDSRIVVTTPRIKPAVLPSAAMAPRQQAEHMTASDLVRPVTHRMSLQAGGHPHMTHYRPQ